MTRVSQLRRAPTRALIALGLLGLGWTYGCSSDSTGSAPPPVIGGSGAAGSAGAAQGGSSASGGSAQSGGEAGALSDAGTAGSLGGDGAGGSAGGAAGGTAGSAGASTTGGASGRAGAAGTSGTAGKAGNGAGGSAGNGTSGGAGASGSAGSGGTMATLCGQQLNIGTGTQLAVSTAGDDTFGGISSDELTITWTVSASGTTTLWYADRASTGDAFATPKSLAIDAAPDHVSVSNDGLRVAFVDADRLGFSEVVRATLGDSFSSAGVGGFSQLAAATAMLPSGESYGDPLFVSDTLFYYSRFGAGRTQTLFLSSRFSAGDDWPPGGAETLPASVQGSGASHAHPTGVSGDGYTLFVWNDATNSELTLSLNPQTGALESGTDLGDRQNAAPNSDCTRIYYTAPGSDGMDLFVANVQ